MPPPLISIPVLRPLAVRTLSMGVAGSLGGAAAGLIAGSLRASLLLLGVWWMVIVFPLGLIERWVIRRRAGWRVQVLIAVVAGLLLFLGGLQYEYGLGVLRGGDLESGYRRMVWVLDTVQWKDAFVGLALVTPFLAPTLLRLRPRPLWRQWGGVLLTVTGLSLPALAASDHLGDVDRTMAVVAVYVAGVSLPAAAAFADWFCLRRWPDEALGGFGLFVEPDVAAVEADPPSDPGGPGPDPLNVLTGPAD